jgi:hypothetical protein
MSGLDYHVIRLYEFRPTISEQLRTLAYSLEQYQLAQLELESAHVLCCRQLLQRILQQVNHVGESLGRGLNDSLFAPLSFRLCPLPAHATPLLSVLTLRSYQYRTSKGAGDKIVAFSRPAIYEVVSYLAF